MASRNIKQRSWGVDLRRRCVCLFFFFKQKTAYEMLRSLVGSEMCIRDRAKIGEGMKLDEKMECIHVVAFAYSFTIIRTIWICLLYTSDAADDLLCVDLGGRRIIKKKTLPITTNCPHPA